jgi:hypothetical protein
LLNTKSPGEHEDCKEKAISNYSGLSSNLSILIKITSIQIFQKVKIIEGKIIKNKIPFKNNYLDLNNFDLIHCTDMINGRAE